jgi:Fe-S-cluster containining protein
VSGLYSQEGVVMKETEKALEIGDSPFVGPVNPVKLGLDDTIQFQCRKGIACFNKCCQNIDIQLTPHDVIRVKNRLGMTSRAFLDEYTWPFEMDHHGMPGVKFKPVEGGTACRFVTEEGCSVYEDRPAACRYYAMGQMTMRAQGSNHPENIHFMVKEEHCLGHDEPRRITVREYRKEQGVEESDALTAHWRSLVLKKRSAGPTVGRPSPRSFQLWFLASYDIDGFREFVFSPSFEDVFILTEKEKEKLRVDDLELMRFAARFLDQVMFGVFTIDRHPDAKKKRLATVEERKQVRDKVANILVKAEMESGLKSASGGNGL